MSEELNLALTTKSRFLANMSHEVRQVVLSCVDLIIIINND